MTVFEAWADVMESVKSVGKGDWNEAQKFSFRGVDATVNAVGPALREHGVSIVPAEILEHSATEYTTGKYNTRMVNRVVRVQWQVFGPDGDSFTGQSMGEAADAGDKALSKALSVAYRVFLLQALCIPTGDPDPDSESHERTSEATTYGRPSFDNGPKQQESDEVPAHIQAAISAADTARAELLAKTESYGWTEEKLVRRYWEDNKKNLRNTQDVVKIKAFGDELVEEAMAQELDEAAQKEVAQSAGDTTDD